MARWRVAVFVLAPAAALAAGWPALLFGWIVPRLLLYPLLSWMSLLAEHRWFDAAQVPPQATNETVEAGRCLRLYRRNRVLELIARGTWLPYGDLFHFAHSTHPAVRWNYLPRLDALLAAPVRTPKDSWSVPARCSPSTSGR